MFRLVKSEVKDLTPSLAQEFRELTPSPTERDLNPNRVKHLMEKATADPCQLVTFHWATARMGNQRWRMNGQHSSTMLCELNGNFPQGLKVHQDEYEVAKEEDLAQLFQQFDDRKSGRSSGDVAGAFQGLYEPVREVPKSSAKIAVDGVVWWRRSVEGISVPAGDKAYELFSETGLHSFIRWIGDTFSIKTPEMRKIQVVSAMYATFTANETGARTFWEQVSRGGVEYEDNAPATILDGWLKNISDKETKDPDLKLKPANYFQACIYAWNAFREEKTIKDIKFDTKKGFLRVIE
jgi:hypothetical protein